MPYIKQSERQQLDSAIDALVLAIQTIPGAAISKARKEYVDSMMTNPDAPHPGYPPADHPVLAMAGRINYVCTRLALKLIAPYKSYSTIAMVSGVFSNMASEFYRRYAVPYEQTKIVENGDLEGYAPDKGTSGL